VTPADRDAARVAYGTGRAIYARLDQIRGPEDAAADIIDLWNAAEHAIRAMLGGSVLSGQALIRELRQRGLIELEQANALVSFLDARLRVDAIAYKPTLTDVGYARAGYNELGNVIERADTGGATASAASATAAGATATAPPTGTPVPSIEIPVYHPLRSTRRKISTPVIAAIAALVLLIAVGGYLFMRGSTYDRALSDGIAQMQRGQFEAARTSFSLAARERPAEAEPHVFLARIARNEGEIETARRELETAIRDEPNNPRALREEGLLLLAQGRFDVASRFLARAVQADTTDPAAKGYLSCALCQLGQDSLALRFAKRAGSGSWSSCAVPRAPVVSTIPTRTTVTRQAVSGASPF